MILTGCKKEQERRHTEESSLMGDSHCQGRKRRMARDAEESQFRVPGTDPFGLQVRSRLHLPYLPRQMSPSSVCNNMQNLGGNKYKSLRITDLILIRARGDDSVKSIF